MKKIFKIFRLCIPPKKKKDSIHFKNLKNGKKLTINGKEYVKVKLRFVDTLNHDSEKIIDNLETENEFLNDKVEKLTEKLMTIENQLSLTKLLNENLLNGDKTESARMRTEVFKIRELQNEFENTVSNLEAKLKNQTEHIKHLENTNQRLKKILSGKQYDIEKLEYKIHNLTTNPNTDNGRKSKKYLENKINTLTKEVSSLNVKIVQQEKLNKSLLGKLIVGK